MKPDNEKTFREIVGESIGEASMCWSKTPEGVFDSTRASKLVDKICNHIDFKLRLESLIKGHMEAMRPLLDKWSELHNNQ